MSLNQPMARAQVTFIDFVYAIVAGYGFEAIDRATWPLDYLFLFFAYFVLVKDWIQEHTRYRNVSYSSTVFVADLIILFLISRMMNTAVTNHDNFYGWVAGLFAIYFAWDYFLRADIARSGYDWKRSACGDLFGVLASSFVWYVLVNMTANTLHIWLAVTAFPAVYGVAFLSWHKKLADRQ